MGFPREGPRSSSLNLVAKMIESFYGTRDAPQLWAEHVGKTVRSLANTETWSALEVHHNEEKDVKITKGRLFSGE